MREGKSLAGNIILCGFMGSGKTSVGRRLAKLLDREFCDLDRFVEERAGMTVSQIFAQFGEEGFREREAQAVEEIAREKSLVVASGGGTVLFPRNVEGFHRGGGEILYLDVPLPAFAGAAEKRQAPAPAAKAQPAAGHRRPVRPALPPVPGCRRQDHRRRGPGHCGGPAHCRPVRLPDGREAGERGKKFLTNTRRGIRLVFVDFFWKQGENTMGPVRCHRFSRFFSLRFTARAYFPWKNGAAAAGGDLSGVPC